MSAILSDAVLAVLKNAVGDRNVLLGDDIGADFKHDELPGGAFFAPDAVVNAGSTEEVAAVTMEVQRLKMIM